MNNHELQFIAWLKSDAEYWNDIQKEIRSIRNRYEDPTNDIYRLKFDEYYKDVYSLTLKDECFHNLEDFTPFSEEFMSHINLDDVCLFLVDSSEFPFLFEEEFEQIDQLIELKRKAEASVKDDGVGTTLGFYLSAHGLRNMEVKHG